MPPKRWRSQLPPSQFTPEYRRGIFTNKPTKILTHDYILTTAARHGINISAIGFGPDHYHVFIEACKNRSIAEAAMLLKGFSSRMMRKHHRGLFGDWLYGRKFWTAGYFNGTVGAVNADTVRLYMEPS